MISQYICKATVMKVRKHYIQVHCSLTLKTVLPHQAIYTLRYKSLADQPCL